MNQAQPVRMTYEKARGLLLTVGAAVLIGLALYQWVTAKNPTEVAGTLLFIPVFLAFVYWGVAGGLVAGVLAAVGYLALYYETISAIGFGQLAPQLIGRMLSFVLFGVLGGWAEGRMKSSLNKLQKHDQICDSTGLYNARFFVLDADLEIARARRYQSTFSAAVIDIPVPLLGSLSRRKVGAVLQGLGSQFWKSVRQVDRPVYGYSGTLHRFAVLLPETPKEGAQVFVDRTKEGVIDWLKTEGVAIDPEQVKGTVLTFPADETLLTGLRDEFAEIERAEFSDKTSGVR